MSGESDSDLSGQSSSTGAVCPEASVTYIASVQSSNVMVTSAV
ncbi:MAG: hypothetical protein RSG78_01865 [Oscillospiraceae bacterium]